jgi:hypothetical protein
MIKGGDFFSYVVTIPRKDESRLWRLVQWPHKGGGTQHWFNVDLQLDCPCLHVVLYVMKWVAPWYDYTKGTWLSPKPL